MSKKVDVPTNDGTLSQEAAENAVNALSGDVDLDDESGDTETEAGAGDTPEAGSGNEGEDEVVVQIGEEPTPQDEEEAKAPTWVKELRKSHRELLKEKRELQSKLEALTTPAQKAEVLGKKPKLEDHDYDSDAYEVALEAWYEQKRKVEAAEAESAKAARASQDAWQQKLEGYGKAKTELKVKDFDDAEGVVTEALSQTQQGILIQGSDNPALLVYALGKNPKKAAELAAVKDPVKFAFAIAKLETQLKVSNRKQPPAPEKTVSGNAPSSSGTVDSTLERLRAEAEKTGNYTKVFQYKKQKRSS